MPAPTADAPTVTVGVAGIKSEVDEARIRRYLTG